MFDVYLQEDIDSRSAHVRASRNQIHSSDSVAIFGSKCIGAKRRDVVFSVANTSRGRESKYHRPFFPIAGAFTTNYSAIPSSSPLLLVSLYA